MALRVLTHNWPWIGAHIWAAAASNTNSSNVPGCSSGGDVCSATYGYRRNNLREQRRAGSWWRLLLQTSLPSWPLFENYNRTAKPDNFLCLQPVGFEVTRYPAKTTPKTWARPPKRAWTECSSHIVLQNHSIFIHLLSFSRLLYCFPPLLAPP